MKHTIYFLFAIVTLSGCKQEQTVLKLSSDGASAESVYLTHDQNENPVVVWTEKINDKLSLIYAISNDDGKSFTKNKVSIPLSADVATHAESMPKVAFKKDGTVIAAFEKKAPTQENKYAGSIYFILSQDKGKTWSQEKFLHSDTMAGRSRSYFDIERLPDGEIGASWLDIKINNETDGRSVRFAKTEGSTFTNEILVDSSACQCCRTEVYTDKSQNVFVAYRGLKKGEMGKQIRDMMIVTSTDQGLNFSSPVLISADNWNIDGCPHTGPSLCSSKAGLISLWFTEAGIFYAHRTAEDSPFSPKTFISGNGRHPQVCANDDRIAMLWEENIDNEKKPITTIRYRIVKDGIIIKNTSLTAKEVNAFLPVVTQSKEGFLAAYLMEQGNSVGVFLKKI